MSGPRDRTTPGTFVTQIAAFPPDVAGVNTALPAFVGYTDRAEIDGRSTLLRPTLIHSMTDFRRHFGGPPMTTFDVVDGAADDFDVLFGDHVYWKLKSSGPIGLLYHSLCLFYDNGGGACYVVSVGLYESEVRETDLISGLESLAGQIGPTMLVVPDLSCLPIATASDGTPTVAGFSDVVKAMLEQCGKMQDRMALLDVVHARDIDRRSLADLPGAIQQFRADVGTDFLSYGIAYIPYLDTTIVQSSDIDAGRIHTKRVVDVPGLVALRAAAANRLNRLPASAAMAGVMTATDHARGVWTAPANIALNAVDGLAFSISDETFADLNKPLDGKAVNVIRNFVGRGPTVWGARTLDGNSNDYRYVQVRRTLIYIEQSVKKVVNLFVFAANDGKTWVSVVATVSNFLQNLWARGGLTGDTAQEAFSVNCGLGTTMGGQDVLDGYMVVQVLVQLIHPAEYIELTFKQKMESAGS